MLTPGQAAGDVDLLLMLSHLEGAGWIDADTAAPLLQRPRLKPPAPLDRLVGVKVAGAPLVVPVAGVPANRPPAYRLSNDARDMLANRTAWVEIPEARKQMILAWTRARGRVSSTEVADLSGLSAVSAGTILTSLESDGLLRAGRPTRMGRGFYYIPTGAPH